MGSSWELYRPELEAVTFPVFVHCYLTLVMFDHGNEVRKRRGFVNRRGAPSGVPHLSRA